MKFLHVSTGDTRGAFAGAHRLHRNLIAYGHESMMLVGDKQSDDPSVVAPAAVVQAFGRLLVRLTNQWFKLVSGRQKQVAHHLAINFDVLPAKLLVARLAGFRPDLVVVYYTSGFLSPAGLRSIQAFAKAPVALYLMDMEMLTGACHYAWDCTGYLATCARCPVPRSRLAQHLIGRQWRRRQEAYRAIHPLVVTGSGWLRKQAAASALTARLPCATILMGIDPSLYAPGDKALLRERFGLPGNALVLYFGAQNLSDPRKGFRHLHEALLALHRELTPAERERVVLFTVGNPGGDALENLPFARVHRAYIAEPGLFAATYAAADLFICPSVEDSGPMMINESIMSGTPVAAFEMGVAVDLVIHGETGYRVALADPAALAAAIAEHVRLSDERRDAMAIACRRLGLATTSAQGQVKAFVELAAQAKAAHHPAT